MSYNLKVKKYRNQTQVHLYSARVGFTGDRDYSVKFNSETGEIFPNNATNICYNPFLDDIQPHKDIDRKEDNIQRSLRRTQQKIYDYCFSNDWEYFVTLTFNPDKVDSFDYEAVTKKLSVWLMNIKSKNKDMKYIVVPELHQSGRYHFHGLFANCDHLNFTDSGKRDSSGRVIYNIGSYRLGWSTATKISHLDAACSYLLKYVTKELCCCTCGKKHYWCTRNLDLPVEEFYSIPLNYREIKDVIGKSVDFTQKECYSDFVTVTYFNQNQSIRQILIFQIDVDFFCPIV